jgi:hypothetical protein
VKVPSVFMPLPEAMMPENVIRVEHIRMGATVEADGNAGRLVIGINHHFTLDFGAQLPFLRRFSAQIADAIEILEAQSKES